MATAIGSIGHSATRGNDPLNILTFPTHERLETGLALTGHRFWAWRQEGIKDWDRSYAPLPSNYVLLDPGLGAAQLPPDVDFDLILSQNKFGQFQVAQQLSRRLHLPLISLEHTLPVPSWGARQLEALRSLRGDLNLFISEFSVGKWRWSPTDSSVRVIHHGVDTDTFSPNDMVCERKPLLLSVVNDWKNRDWCMPAGQRIWTTLGFIPIEKIGVGHEVLTDDGTCHRVSKVFERDYFGDMVTISLSRDMVLRFTPSHAVRVYRDGQWKYVESSRLRSGDKLRYPRHQPTDFTLNDLSLAWLIGLVAGDGSISASGTVSVSCHAEERDVAQRACDIMKRFTGHASISDRHRSRGANAITTETTDKWFGNWLAEQVGSKSTKRLPDCVMCGNAAVRLAALQGVWTADGTFKNGKGNSPRACFSNISPRLAGQVSALLHSFGVTCSVRREKRTTNKSNGQEMPIYRVVSYGKENVERCLRLIEDGDAGEPSSYTIESVGVEREWSGKVYNCEVANDHSYIVYPGFVAHNCCGYSFWQEATHGLPVQVVGKTPGLSEPAKSVHDLVMKYRSAAVFVNTSLISPVPTALLEAMACGCAVVSTATCMIPEIITQGENGLLANGPEEMAHHCRLLLSDPARCERMGKAARETVLSRFSMGDFVANWDALLRSAAEIPYRGPNA